MKRLIATLVLLLVLVGCGEKGIESFTKDFNEIAKQYKIDLIEDDDTKKEDDGYYITTTEYTIFIDTDDKGNATSYYVNTVNSDKDSTRYDNLTSEGHLAIQAVAKILGLDIDELYDAMVSVRKVREEEGTLAVEVDSYRENGYQITIEEIGNMSTNVWFKKMD